VVEEMVELVKRSAERVAGVERKGGAVGVAKARREPSEQVDIRGLHLARAVVDRRIKENRLVSRRQKVPAPQVAVQQDRSGGEAVEQRLHPLCDVHQLSLARIREKSLFPRKEDLRHQTAVAIEQRPVEASVIPLREEADEVVALQPELTGRRKRVPMQRCQL